jgi:hypothetical protein
MKDSGISPENLGVLCSTFFKPILDLEEDL